MDDYLALNMANWNERVPAHVASPDYHVERFLADPAYLSAEVRFDQPRLGDIGGLRAVHLQCHIGTDTISLARLGAAVTGVDFSAPAMEQARILAERTGADATFVQADVYGSRQALGDETFDLVYTGIGALCWLPDIAGWGGVVASLLCPGGRLFLREGHPMMWAIDGRSDGLLAVEFPYFETAEPVVLDGQGTYVATDAQFTHTVTHEWNHGIGEIVTALLGAGMEITALDEHDTVPWEALPGLMERAPNGEWRLADRPWRLPHSYTLRAVKRA